MFRHFFSTAPFTPHPLSFPQKTPCFLLAAVLAGCGGSAPTNMKSTSSQSTRAEGQALFAPLPKQVDSTPNAPSAIREEQPGSAFWSIVIENYPTIDDGPQRAQAALVQVQTVGQLPGVYLEKRGKRIVLAYGRYEGLADPQARTDLDRIRSIVIAGERPYQRALLSPPMERAVYGSVPEWDLRNARANFGPDALYSLQVGIYGRLQAWEEPSPAELDEYRAFAEDAVARLRREGEMAFYFHGPRRSTVTVGIFGPADHDPMKPHAESMQLRMTRERHPYNVHNGFGIKETVATQTGGRHDFLQPSMLIAIPKN